MTKHTGPTHVVVDGSNIATEGRSVPSLAQLNDAVLAFMAERPDITVTVVVDATFGHRINKSEAKEFDEAVANNELVAPPAGAVGRGDAFVLGIADKAGALVFSNDSFQEFHGQYEWLFDQGRLIGGKPVPHVGWVFVERVPVRGPTSRKAVRDSQRGTPVKKAASAPARLASRETVGSTTAGGRTPSRRGRSVVEVSAHDPMPVPTTPPPGPALRSDSGQVNDLLPFLDFAEHHPVGTSVNAIVETYSSHGAYVKIGEVRAYVPLRLMSSPPPKSAREVMKIGEAITLVVAEYAPARRSIDCALPHMAAGTHVEDPSAVITAAMEASQSDGPSPRRQRPRRSAATTADETHNPKEGTAMATTPAKKTAAKKPAAKKPAAAKPAAPKKAAAKKAAAKPAAPKKAAAKPTAAKPAAAKPAAPKKAAVKPAAPKKAAAKKAAPKKPAAPKKAAAKKAAAKPAAPKKVAAKKPAAAKKVAAKKAPARR
jgi:hypothetical protein